MANDHQIEPSDFMDGWPMVRKHGERTQHFRTQQEAERYAKSPAYRDQVNNRRPIDQSDRAPFDVVEEEVEQAVERSYGKKLVTPLHDDPETDTSE